MALVVRKAAVAEKGQGPDERRLARLERAGMIRPASRRRLEEIFRVPPEPGGDVLAALLDERRSGR